MLEKKFLSLGDCEGKLEKMDVYSVSGSPPFSGGEPSMLVEVVVVERPDQRVWGGALFFTVCFVPLPPAWLLVSRG